MFDLSEKLNKVNMSVKESEDDSNFNHVKSALFAFKKQRSESETDPLWFRYIDTVEIVWRFINTEQPENWVVHLLATSDLLPYIAVSGHHLYTKLGYLYLQTIVKLPQINLSLHKYF